MKTYSNKEWVQQLYLLFTVKRLVFWFFKSYRRNQGNAELKTIDIKEDSQFVILGQRRSEKETGELWNEGRLKSWRLSHLAKRIAKTARMGHLGSAANNRPPLLLALLTVIRRLEATIRLLFVFNQWKGSGYGLNWGEEWCFNRIKQRTLIIFVNILLKPPTEEFIFQINIQPYFIRIL